MILNDLCKFTLVSVLCSILISCSKKDESAQKELEKQQAEFVALKKKEELLKRELQATEEEKRDQEQEQARLKADEMAEKARILDETILREENEAKEKLAFEQESKRLEEIARRQEVQKVALQDFVDTKYEELELLDGKVLKSAKVTAASPSKVSFIHEGGVAVVKYDNLSREIRELCKYDAELEAIELEEAQIAAQLKSSPFNSNNLAANSQNKPNNLNEASPTNNSAYKSQPAAQNPVGSVKPKGNLSVRVVGTSRGSKTIEVIAKSNVDAVLYLNDYWRPYREHQVKANQVYRHTWTHVNVKYEVKLTAQGQILGRASSGRKSGLGKNGGL